MESYNELKTETGTVQQPLTASNAPSFNSIEGVDEREHYEHLCQLF